MLSFGPQLVLATVALLTGFALLFRASVAVSAGAKILMLPLQTRSHVIGQLALGELLAARGHRVHMAIGSSNPVRQRVERAGVRVMPFTIPDDVMTFYSEEYERYLADTVFFSKNKFEEGERLIRMMHRDCELMMADSGFVSAARELRFDLAVFDAFPFLPCTLILPHNLSVPYIGFTAVIEPWALRMPSLPSYRRTQTNWMTPDTWTFLERLKGLVDQILVHNLGLAMPVINNQTLLEKYSQEKVSWDELLRKSLLLLWEQSPVADYPSAIYPNTVLVPGLTISPVNRVEGQLGSILDGAQQGVVLLTFGATSNYLPKEIVLKFLRVFASLEQLTFLVKFVVPEGVTIAQNVVVKEWLPQNDILGHKNTKLFITHCGNNGQYEAIYHAVPTIGFPQFGDQTYNCQRARLKGFGLQMNIHDFTVEQLRTNILKVIENPIYADTVNKASEIWRHERMTSREKAAYWIEHVIKYGGDHLRPRGYDMTLLEFLMVDVLVIYLVAVLAFVAVLCSSVKYCVGRLKRIVVGLDTNNKPERD